MLKPNCLCNDFSSLILFLQTKAMRKIKDEVLVQKVKMQNCVM